MKDAAQFVPGLIFGIGLAVSGMTNPEKVLAFLDVSGAWDPSLALVMLGAILSFSIFNLLIHRRKTPVLGGKLPGPRSTGKVNGRLLAGAALFGAGWGLSGVCPGPALANLTTLRPEFLSFLVAMVGGMVVAQRVLGADAPPAGAEATIKTPGC